MQTPIEYAIRPPKARLPAKTAELSALTGLRFFAAIYVVFYHFVSPNLHTSIWPLKNLLSVGYSSVSFFFVLSGFVLTYSCLRSDGQVKSSRITFWKARLSRIYPAYLLAFLLAAPFQILGSIHVNGWRVALEKLTVGSVLVLALLQAWTPWTAWFWNIPAWSLSVELFFYFCFPFAALMIGRWRSRACLRAAAGIWLAGLIVPALYWAIRPMASQPPFPMLQLAIETNPIMRLPEFLCGMLVGRVFALGFRWNRQRASALSMSAFALVVLVLSFSSAIPRLLLSNSIMVPLSALLIFALAHQSGALASFLSHPTLRVLGEASYATYILQFPISYIFHLNNQTFTAQRFLLYLITLIGVSVLTFYFVEQPLRRRLRSKMQPGARNSDIQHNRPQFAQEGATL
jgi:peptidoglycan/LPS O-acetylase OafA/YrhL